MKLKEAACKSLHMFKTHILLLFAALAQGSWLVNILIRVPLALMCLLRRVRSSSRSPTSPRGWAMAQPPALMGTIYRVNI